MEKPEILTRKITADEILAHCCDWYKERPDHVRKWVGEGKALRELLELPNKAFRLVYSDREWLIYMFAGNRGELIWEELDEISPKARIAKFIQYS